MSKQESKNKAQILRPIKKMVSKKAGPTELAQLEMLKDKAVGDYLRLSFGVPGGKLSEMILHHPIGVSDLDSDDWVLSSPEELAQMKARSKDPNAASIHANRTKYVRECAVRDDQLVVQNGSVHYFNHTDKEDRGKFLDNLKKKTIKKHEKEDDYKYILDLALRDAGIDQLAQAEMAYRKYVKPIQEEALKRYPQNFRTAKGPLEDVQQSAIGWLKSQKIAEVGPSLLRHGVTGPAIVVDSNADNDDFTIDSSSGTADQWFFFQLGDKSKKKKIREAISKIRKEHGLNFTVLIKDE